MKFSILIFFLIFAEILAKKSGTSSRGTSGARGSSGSSTGSSRSGSRGSHSSFFSSGSRYSYYSGVSAGSYPYQFNGRQYHYYSSSYRPSNSWKYCEYTLEENDNSLNISSIIAKGNTPISQKIGFYCSGITARCCKLDCCNGFYNFFLYTIYAILVFMMFIMVIKWVIRKVERRFEHEPVRTEEPFEP